MLALWGYLLVKLLPGTRTLATPPVAEAHGHVLAIPPCRAGLGLAPGTNAVVSNGRVVTAGPGEELTAEDFDLMNLYAEVGLKFSRVVGS